MAMFYGQYPFSKFGSDPSLYNTTPPPEALPILYGAGPEWLMYPWLDTLGGIVTPEDEPARKDEANSDLGGIAGLTTAEIYRLAEGSGAADHGAETGGHEGLAQTAENPDVGLAALASAVMGGPIGMIGYGLTKAANQVMGIQTPSLADKIGKTVASTLGLGTAGPGAHAPTAAIGPDYGVPGIADYGTAVADFGPSAAAQAASMADVGSEAAGGTTGSNDASASSPGSSDYGAAEAVGDPGHGMGDIGGGGSGGGDGGCVIATHAVSSGAFSTRDKREAVVWCTRNWHGKWYGEACRRGYRFMGKRAIAKGTAHKHYNEFRDYVAFATGKRRTLKGAIHFAARTAQFFVLGLILRGS